MQFSNKLIENPLLQCDKLCGEGKQTRKVTCYKVENGKRKALPNSECDDEVPESEQKCMLAPCEGVDWITSQWSGVSYLDNSYKIFSITFSMEMQNLLCS